MFIHPNFNPVAISIGPLSIHWYALSYIVGFILFSILGRYRIKKFLSILNKEQLDDLLTIGILGIILGGRLGYVFFYNAPYFMAHPIDIFKVWQGGMSFHGGFIGSLVAIMIFARKHKFTFAQVADNVAPLIPLGLASGRMGNFINGELWGRITSPDAFWAMGFPQAQVADKQAAPLLSDLDAQQAFLQYGMLPRHPSQLYELLLEGIILFIILWVFSKKSRPTGQVAALFILGYGVFRFLIEFTRQPDSHLGLLSLNMSMGQWLSLPMIIIALIWFIKARNNDHLSQPFNQIKENKA
ncbi:MAG: prolipoprotein diacylglyceryl transferase [Neisseriaceae bacterium]|nr:prolipoprotein diacylglyceryl transferase [Neisseriaceae bacterium]